MKPIKDLNTSHNGNHKFEVFPKSDKFNEINIHVLNDVVFTGSSLYYPNLVLYSNLDNTFYQPLEESTMSLRNVDITHKINASIVVFLLLAISLFFQNNLER